MADMEDAERSSGFFERLLFYTLPILFTLLLTGVLLTVFGFDVKNEALKIGNNIPFLSAILPDPEPSDKERIQALDPEKEQKPGADNEEIAMAAEAKLQQKEAEVSSLQADLQAKDEQISELAAELEASKTTHAHAAATDEEYAANIRQLAKVYADMKPRRAASVMENLTLSERVLIFREMKSDQQVDILENMSPAIAAETSILLKDVISAKDLQIAALQERLALTEAKPASPAKLTRDELSRTIAQMTPGYAAEVLLEMAAADETSVVDILRAMEERSRATILNSLTELDKERTARITAMLG